jgi:hypothetical protein
MAKYALAPMSVCFTVSTARFWAALPAFAPSGASAWPYAALPASAAIPIKTKVLSIPFIPILVSVFNFTLIRYFGWRARANKGRTRIAPELHSMPETGNALAGVLERYFRICGFSVIVQGGSCVHAGP